MAIERKREKKRNDFETRRRERESLLVKEEELPLDATPSRIKYSKRSGRRMMAIERDRLAKKEKKRQYLEWKTKEMESRKPGNTVTIGTDLLKRIRFPSESVDGEVRTDKPKKKKTVKPNSCDEPIKKKKKRDDKGRKSHQGDLPAVNTGGPIGNQSQNTPFQQATAFNGGGGGGGMNVGAVGFGGGQGSRYGGGGSQFGNGNPMHFVPFQGNRQFNEQSVSEVMQAMQVLANHNILGLGFGLGVAAMAQMRTGQESQMTANHGSAGFGDGHGDGGQGGQGGGPQGDQLSWRFVMAKGKQKEPKFTADGRKKSKIGARRWRKKRAIERDRLAKKEKKRQDLEWKTKEIESRNSGDTVTIGTDLLKRIRFPSESEDGEVRTDKPKKKKTVKTTRPTRHDLSLPPSSLNSSNSDEVSESRSKKRKNSEMISEHQKEKKLKSSTKKQKERKQVENCDQPKKKMKKRGKEGQKSLQRDPRATNTGGPIGNQSQNTPFQQAPAFNGGGGGGGMNVGSAGCVSDHLSIKILIPPSAVGAIIGKAGEAMHSLKNGNNCRIQISKNNETYLGTSERICLVKGRLNNIMAVIESIQDKIRNTALYHKNTSRGNKIRIMMPNSSAGIVIGKSGANMKDIRKQFGCQIKVYPKARSVKAKTSLERVVTVAHEESAALLQAASRVLEKVASDPHHSSEINKEDFGKASGPNGASNTGGPTGNQSQNAPFQQAPAFNGGGGGGGMNVGAAGFGGGQGGGYGGGGPPFGNGNPMESFQFQGNRQFSEQSASEVMQAMQVSSRKSRGALGVGYVVFGLGVAAMAQMRTGQESEMTANHGSAGFGDGYGGGGQGGHGGSQGDQVKRLLDIYMLIILPYFSLPGVNESREKLLSQSNPIELLLLLQPHLQCSIKKKRDEKSQKSHQGDSRATNTGGPTGNQSQNAPFQQATAFNGGGGGGGMNVGSAGFGGGQGQFGGYGCGGPQFGNGNPMESFSFHGNRQFNEQSVSEVMQAMQVLANHNILRLGFGVGVAAMAQMRTGQESQMTANHGSAGFGDGYSGGVQGGGQGDQSHWRQ
ncbi:hypothetical protein CRE_21287 [Caenorhabditis remanei]|uniref:K Homology domain-containing protein n=1 Tax=Caenorhabditis remanei TaxID=31234 RepID=E3MF91_CAERE|nr:hypothetical protein CRE_21287 [Caenorhabditis remanei]